MTSPPTPPAQAGSITANTAPQTPLRPTSARPLRREGAIYFLSAEEQALADAMQRSSPPPEHILGKRTRTGDNSPEGDDTEPEDSGSPLPHTLLPNISNVTAAALRYATQKKLRPEQRDEMDAYLLDSPLGRQAKLFACVLALENKINAFQSATPAYQLSEELKTNINNYVLAVVLSVNISAYKGNIPRNHVLDILRRYRFDLPVGIEHDYSAWDKISTYVSYSLTQFRANIKKKIIASIDANINIFSLAQIIVHGTFCRPTIQLCARVALMRAVFVECNGSEKLWNSIDARLDFIRGKAQGSSTRTTRAFNVILRADRSKYGTPGEEYTIADTVPDERQQRVDDVIAGTVDTVDDA